MIKLLSIADIVSLINACFGFTAIIVLFSNLSFSDEMRIRLSFSFILLAILGDGLDGIIARKTHASKLGEYLEAMADMTSLGIAPAIFIYTIYYNLVASCIYCYGYLIFALIIFIVLSVIRLASFHIMKKEDFFVGLPASASTIILLIVSYLKIEYFYILPIIVIISFIMVSNIRFPKLNIKMDTIATVLILLTLIMDKMYYSIAPILLLLAIISYAIGGPFYLRLKKINTA
ncbi:MAG: hypothetical protein DRO67_01480 [Candidatus Asgardarchaeum californiense]|nr:MAG: hypothetical protein DRO67_01480 [Candidatus Asgardarchaeum californiense]